ncbi:peptide-methionine (S)-S-oxide reductase MsrA [Cuniculiplasma sp. SKW4]|uniref:peptide-methionine (S)-S-oxide reductase MsrA n=1 Tax=Cuniculiplasma sp. SKW4 TaxID=3400171 RepID=UPI003FD335F7
MIDEIILGGGCFWCTEAIYERVNGVVEVIPGYSGGSLEHPSYEDVCTGNTGHAEVVKIKFDTDNITLKQILEIFFEIHDPTTLNRQGADVGTQYRSIIVCFNENQYEISRNYIEDLSRNGHFKRPIVTKVEMFKNFYPAEEYHKRYYDRNNNNPYCKIVIDPKIKKFMKLYEPFLK